uniref:Plakophilin-4 n=1 Tax=Rhabditophanes sp. KR3021 TaxID=114890 RepID=A0AC35UCD2_9BILA
MASIDDELNNTQNIMQKGSAWWSKASYAVLGDPTIPKISVDCRGTTLKDLGIKESWIPPGKRLAKALEPEVELLTDLELLKSIEKMQRSRSYDSLGFRRESYLSRFSRENTPSDSIGAYSRQVRRSYSDIRQIAGYKVVEDQISSGSRQRREPIAHVTTPYYTNINYAMESEPLRKYDVFSLRTWAYPIHKYIYGRNTEPSRPYSYTRSYACTSQYTPPTMGAEARGMNERRGYSGYSHMAGEHSFNVSAKPWSLSSRRVIPSPYVGRSPSSYYDPLNGYSTQRNYNSYRPRSFSATVNTYWKPYY